jgi:hypothetical protein
MIPSAIDFTAGVVGLPSLSNWMRFGISVPVGVLCGVFLAVGVADTVDRGRLGPDQSRDHLQ